MNKPSKPQENTTNHANISFVIVKEINVMARANTQKENATNTANISNEKEINVMAKRTQKQIEKDYELCQKFMANNTEVTSIRELAECLSLTEKKVMESYENHPISYKRLKEKLKLNRISQQALKKAEAKRKAEQEAAEAKRKAEQEAEAKRKAEQEAEEVKRKAEQEAEARRKAEQKSANAKQTKKKVDEPSTKKKEDSIGGFVIDASIAGVEGILDDLNRICVTQNKIILTTVTINELEKMQKFHDNDGYDARRILSMAADDSEHFESVLIDDTLGTPDYCIVKYCADNKDNVVLLTADKTMALNARARGVKTHFFKHTVQNSHTVLTSATDDTHKLHLARKVAGEFYLCDFENDSRSVRVVSDGIEYTRGTVKLKIGDDVYVTTKKFDYVTFAHYQITSLSEDCNCTLVYHKRMYNSAEINNLPLAGYKAFMRDFARRIKF